MNKESLQHYYGGTVRVIFVVAGIVMILSYPFFSSFINQQIARLVIGLVVIGVFGGLLSPKRKWVILCTAVISFIAFAIFEYATTYTYMSLPPLDNVYVAFFWVDQVLSLIFFFALYLSIRTFRNLFISERKEREAK